MEKIKNFFSEKITLLFVIIVLLAVASGILLYQFFQLTDEVEKANTALENNEQMLTSKESEIKTLTQTREDLIKQIAESAVNYDERVAGLNAEIKELKDRLDQSYVYPDYVLNELTEHGYTSPQALLDTLTEHHELIQIEGILGGTMRWWPEASILINDKYAFGNFEDGHIYGYSLLEYTFDDNDVPVWKIISTYMQ